MRNQQVLTKYLECVSRPSPILNTGVKGGMKERRLNIYIYIYICMYVCINTLRNEGEKVIYILSCFSRAQLFATLQAIAH